MTTGRHTVIARGQTLATATLGRKQRQTFSYRVIQKWNLLPADVKMAKSLDLLDSFKNRLDECLLKTN